jgi:hypothetical protein
MKKAFDIFGMTAAAFVLLAAAGAGAGAAPSRSQPLATMAVQANPAPHPAPEQPLPYSHRTHVAMALPCQLCHTSPAPGTLMTFPATSTCMNCHATIVTDRPAIKKLTEYAKSKRPIPWVRVYRVLPGVTWTHRKHVEAGVQCETCHGAVGDLEAMSETTAVTGMASCISCHQAHGVSAACTVCHAWPAK